MKKLSLFAIPTLLLIWGITGIQQNVGAVQELQPDMEPFAAEDLVIEETTDGKKLRFSTLSWNKGSGPLEVVAGSVNESEGTQQVFQRVYLDNGSYNDQNIGTFVWHDAHDHFHLEDYALYTLQPVDAPGASERTGTKMSFCLMDTDRIDHKLDGAPKRPQYTECSNEVQGISVGWGDKYGYQLVGQSIDISDLPNGTYDLVIEIDPKGRLIEETAGNNTSTVRIRIEDTSVTQVEDTDDGDGNNGNGGGNDDPPGHGGTPPGQQ